MSISVNAQVIYSQASVIYNNDLTIGSSGSDVTNLQTWLIANHFDIPAISSGQIAKGYFGNQTKAALIAYQRSVGLTALGFFGPLTRARLNGNPGVGGIIGGGSGGGVIGGGSGGGIGGGIGGIINDGSLRIISPNGGETLARNTYQTITWTASSPVLSQRGSLYLQSYIPPCAEPNAQGIRCMIAVRAPILLADNVDLSSRSYVWRVSAALSSTDSILDGQYKIKICLDNGNYCDLSDNYFNIGYGSSNGSDPVINGIDAPTTLSVSQSGTWTVRATDPANNQLTYSVDWGDSPYASGGTSIGSYMGQASSQASTFTHSYSSVGTYKVTFTISNTLGHNVQTSVTVNVVGSGGSTAGPLSVTTPNGGEIWVKGKQYLINWTSPYYFRATYADIKLVPLQTSCPYGYSCQPLSNYTIASNISINQNSFTWRVGDVQSYTAIPEGSYKIMICEVNSSNCDSSDNYFSIRESLTLDCPAGYICTPAPSIY